MLKRMLRKKHLFIAGGSKNEYNHYEQQFESSSEEYKNNYIYPPISTLSITLENYISYYTDIFTQMFTIALVIKARKCP